MLKRRLWFWIVLFIFVVLLLGILATGWNVVLVRDYQRILELAGSLSRTPAEPLPWVNLVLGTLGFIVALGVLILFFVKLLREMRLNDLQAEFLAQVSHELKTPIATMELSSSLLRNGSLSPEESRELWDSHDAELKRLREEVELLLESARLQSPYSPLRNQIIPLDRWVEESLPRWRKILGPDSSIERVGDALPCQARVDLRMLNLITDNLVDNARKFARGTPRLTVRSKFIASENPWKPGKWQLQFEDQGWGFSSQDSKRIFKRFVRAKTLSPHAIPGTGLGLYLAATASRAMGIHLKGESGGPNQGAVFTLEGHDLHKGAHA